MTVSRLAVLGQPISQSLSPALFEPVLHARSADAFYIRVTGSCFPAIISFAERIGIEFANVTHPFKEDAAILSGNRLSEVVRTGSANGIFWSDGERHLWNTDSFGIRHALSTAYPSLKHKSILVMGAGGAGRAALDAVIQQGARTYVWNRSRDRLGDALLKFPEATGVQTGNLNEIAARMDGFVWSIPGYPEFVQTIRFRSDQAVLDANYNRRMTTQHPFSPARRIDGMQWLTGQAAESMKRLNLTESASSLPVLPQPDPGTSHSEKKVLALIGFMGSGKTTVGRLLARHMHRPFIDLDALIEREHGRSIPAIFRESGEKAFRLLEGDALTRVDYHAQPVVATGGGAASNPIAADWLREHAHCIWLYRPLDTLKDMAEGPEGALRPLLQVESCNDLFNERIIDYARCCDIAVAGDPIDRPEDMVRLLLKEPLVNQQFNANCKEEL